MELVLSLKNVEHAGRNPIAPQRSQSAQRKTFVNFVFFVV